jgi:hypothetical protein
MDTLDAAIAAKKRHTPERGVNLCEIDDFEFPPNNLIYLNSFADEADAREAAEYEYPDTQKFVMLFADGSGVGIDKTKRTTL